MSSIVIFGAGNIGRSFIGSIFASNGYKVIFVDAAAPLVNELNRRKSYPVIIKRGGQPDERMEISGISAIHSSDTAAVTEALTECSLCATSVGQNALKFVVPVIAEAAKQKKENNLPPLDIIIAENIRNGAELFRSIFRENGLTGNEAGFVETSIGKMVPIMTGENLAEDPLVLHAEEYNTLILDRNGFLNKVPDLPEIKAVSNIAAWVDRKLFIHNLGHAASAYLGYRKYPEKLLVADIITDAEIRDNVRKAMKQSAAALLAEYPSDFTEDSLDEHIEDLIHRFSNRALGDSIFRVGRDLYRKLDREDRLVGAAALCLKHGLPCDAVAEVIKAALMFRASGPDGLMYRQDEKFHAELAESGFINLLTGRLHVTDQALISLLT